MKKLIYILLLLLVSVVSFVFIYFNTQLVTIHLGLVEFEVNLAIVLVASLLLGLIMGYALSIPARIRLRAKLMKANKQITN